MSSFADVVYVGAAARGVGEVTRAPTRRVNPAVDGVEATVRARHIYHTAEHC
jgi:hypothetical protein